MQISLVPASDLKPALYNPRQSDAERLALVRLSLQKLGFLLPLLATPEGEILSGHQRHAEALNLGASRLPVTFLDVTAEKRRGLNILCNRATNDIPVMHSERDMSAELRSAALWELAAALPDVAPDSAEFWPCLRAREVDVRKLAALNVRDFKRQAGNVASMLKNFGVQMPIVLDPAGRVVNGIGRLEAAARKGQATIPAVTVSGEQAELARLLLNYLSMDFTFIGENADALRFGAFRRQRLRRRSLGTAFALPVYKSRRNKDVDLSKPEHLAKWISMCGDIVLDFGCGHGDEARMLREQGIDVTAWEPYPEVDGGPCLKTARLNTMDFLSDVRRGKAFSSIFLSSVLNSVPFPEDRRHIIRVCAALCSPDTVLFAAARGTHDPNWRMQEQGEILSSRGGKSRVFKLAQENGLTIGDLNSFPKIQKHHSKEEFAALFGEFFGQVEAGKKATSVTAICRKPLAFHPCDLAASIRFEFDLPYPGGKRLGLSRLALDAFSHRLGLDLEAV